MDLIFENNTANTAENNAIFLRDPFVAACYTFLFILTEIVGNFLLFCLILFEKYGMDPQKRTTNNILFSSICGMMILFNLISLPIPVVREVWGPVGKIS